MAGSIYRLAAGHADIGSGHAASFRIRDGAIPAVPCGSSLTAAAAARSSPTRESGHASTASRSPLPRSGGRASSIAVGSSLLGLAHYEPPDAALHPSADGSGIDFNRPPRLLPPERVTRFQLPMPPSEAERRPLPILMAALPLVMGVVMAFLCIRCTCWRWPG